MKLMNFMSRMLLSTFTIVLFMAGLPGCGSSDAKIQTPAPVAPVAAIAAIHPEKGSFTSSVRIPGELLAYQHVDLYAKVNSFVSKLYADVGTEVVAGQLLATMEAPELNAQLNGASSRLKSQEAIYLASKSTYDRLLQTSKTPGTISPHDLEQAYARQLSDLSQLDAARAAYREVSDTRNYLRIHAPFSGVITARNVSAGAYVGPSGKGSEFPLFTLHEQKKLRLVVSVPETYVGYLNQNSEVRFTVKAFPSDSFQAKVTRLAGALDSRLRSQRIEMDVLNTSKRLLPGMVAEIVISLRNNEPALLVPTTAILNSTQGVYVIKVQGKKTIWIKVTTGKNSDGKTEVYGNLNPSDTLLQNVTEEIRNGGDAPLVTLAK